MGEMLQISWLRCQFPASNLVELSVVLILSDRVSGAGLMI